MIKPWHLSTHALLISMLLFANGCGGDSDMPDDVYPSGGQPAPQPVDGPDSFLLLPKQIVEPTSRVRLDIDFRTTTPTNSSAYARAYYAAIDAGSASPKDTLERWKFANGFGDPARGGKQFTAVFGDFRDLGYGRRMTARQNLDDGSIAFIVENYVVNSGNGGYGQRSNLDAAIVEDRQWIISINAIEFSARSDGSGKKFVKFFSFDPNTGARKLTQDLDGRGEKALPGVCISCHGGRVDPLDTEGRFPLMPLALEDERGDSWGRLHPLNVDKLTFSPDRQGFSRGDQEAVLKEMNKLVLCTYPRKTSNTSPEDQCREIDNSVDRWQAPAAAVIVDAYGGNRLPDDKFTPSILSGWNTEEDLYRNVVRPACINCHLLLGTGSADAEQSQVDFSTFEKFKTFDSRTKFHVFVRGNMPLSKIGYDRFWSMDPKDGNTAKRLAEHLGIEELVQPGQPYADPGPNRNVGTRALVRLSGKASLYADRFQWRIEPESTGARLENPETAEPDLIFTLPPAGAEEKHTLTLTVFNEVGDSSSREMTVFRSNNGDIALTQPSFEDVVTIYAEFCAVCHTGSNSPDNRPSTPIFVDSDAEDSILTPEQADSLYSKFRGNVNFSDVEASPLLLKPSGDRHDGSGRRTDQDWQFDKKAELGEPVRKNYEIVLNWILDGAPRRSLNLPTPPIILPAGSAGSRPAIVATRENE